MTMKIIPAAKFKEHCLALLDEVDPEGILITKRGKPVARLIPVERKGAELLGILRNKLRVRDDDDLFTTGIRWEADAEP